MGLKTLMLCWSISALIVLIRSFINTPFDGVIFVFGASIIGGLCLDDDYLERFIKLNSWINKQKRLN